MERRYAGILPSDGYSYTPRANILDSRPRRTSGHRKPDFCGTLSRQQATDRNGALMGWGEDASSDRGRRGGNQNYNDRRRATTAALSASGTNRQRSPSHTICYAVGDSTYPSTRRGPPHATSH